MADRSFTNVPDGDAAKNHLLAVANFIGWFDPDHMQGGVKAEEAFESLCALLNVPRGRLLNIVRGKPEQGQTDVR